MTAPTYHAAKISLLGACLILIAGLRLFGADSGELARYFIVNYGYQFIFCLFGCFLWVAWQSFRQFSAAENGTKNMLWSAISGFKGVIVLIFLLACIVHLHEPHRLRTLLDEYVLLATSQIAHLQKNLAYAHLMVYVDNTPTYFGQILDFRLPLFPFLLSLLHDLSGYRVSNLFIFNGLLTGLFFSLLYGFIRDAFGSTKLGILALLLAFSVPLLAQVATSGGYDLFNACLILGLSWVAFRFWNNPNSQNQTLLVYLGLLLGSTRYESILYLAAVAIIVGVSWIKKKKIELSWWDCISPVFLVLPVAYNIYYVNRDDFNQPTGAPEGFFNWYYFQDNMSEAIYYFFANPGTSSTSVLVAGLGILSLVYMGVRSILRRRDLFKDSFVAAYAPILGVAGTVICLVFCNYWGQLTDYQAVRFALPVFVVAIPLSIWFIQSNGLDRGPALNTWIIFSIIYCIAFSLPAQSLHKTTKSMSPSYLHEYFLDFAKKLDRKEALFISTGSMGFIAHGFPAVTLNFANANPDRILDGYRRGQYKNIYAIVTAPFEPKSQKLVYYKNGQVVSEDFRFKPIDSKQFSDSLIFVICRITEIRGDDGVWGSVD
jgi:hypothetical protein